MKKSLVLSLCLLCALVLCACGDTAASQNNTAYVGLLIASIDRSNGVFWSKASPVYEQNAVGM